MLLVSVAGAQTRIIEQLKQRINVAATPRQKINAILQLCDESNSLHADTLMTYAKAVENIAIGLRDVQSEVWAMYYESTALTNKGLLDSAMAVAQKGEEILRNNVDDPLLLANILNQKGRCYVRKNQYKEAIGIGYTVISIAEKNNDVLLQVKAKTLIGWAYLEMGQTSEALLWHLRAMRTSTDSLLLEKYAILFANIATNYNGLNKMDSAFYYINKAITYSRRHENLFALSNSLAIASELYVKSGKPKFSEPLLKEVVAIRKLIGDPFYTASDMAQLGYYYAHYGQPDKGVEICNEGIDLARKYKLGTKLFFLYESLADNYLAMGNTKEYARVMDDIIRLKDSVYAINSSVALADLNAKYELQKKEKTIMQQQFDLVQKTYWMYGIGALLLFGAILWFINYKNNRRKQEQKMALVLLEEKRLAEKAILVAQELERKRIAADLHDNLGAYAAAISSNVDHISMAANHANGDQLVYEELKTNAQSIVSQLNDTIWVLTKEVLALTAISDRLKVFIMRLQNSYPAVQIDVKEEIKADRLLAPMQAFHLFKILQEAIINALKHSHCTRITIMIESNIDWKISIADDGRGMTESRQSSTGGNGLYNMKNRAKAAGWNISWQPHSPTGTCVIITPTTN